MVEFPNHKRIVRRCLAGTSAAVILIGGSVSPGCVSVKTQHKIEPIHITMDVNLRLEKELEETFSVLDQRTRALANEADKEEAP